MYDFCLDFLFLSTFLSFVLFCLLPFLPLFALLLFPFASSCLTQVKNKPISAPMFLPFRPWDDETLSRAYDVLLDELVLPPSAPGGKVEFRRSLALSFLFKFNLEVLQKLRELVRLCILSSTFNLLFV